MKNVIRFLREQRRGTVYEIVLVLLAIDVAIMASEAKLYAPGETATPPPLFANSGGLLWAIITGYGELIAILVSAIWNFSVSGGPLPPWPVA